MNKDTFEGNWEEFKGKVQKQWGKLTDDHLDQVNGSRRELSGAIQKNYGIAVEEADRQVAEWEKTLDRAA